MNSRLSRTWVDVAGKDASPNSALRLPTISGKHDLIARTDSRLELLDTKHPPFCYRLLMAGRVSIVSFQDRIGGEWYCVTAGRSVFEAVQNAMSFFAHDYSKGPKPNADVIFKVALVGDDRTWRVRADRVLNCDRKCRDLFG